MDFSIRGLDLVAPLWIRHSPASDLKLQTHGKYIERCLGASLGSVSSQDRQQLIKVWGKNFLEEAQLLSLEKDSHIFFQGLWVLATRLESEERFAAAASVYSTLGEALVPASIRERAGKRLQVLRGGGAFGPRILFSLERLGDELWRPSPWVAMGAAGVTYRWVRLGTTARLLESTPWLGEFGIHALAAGSGLFAESLSFTAVLHGIQLDQNFLTEWKSAGAMLLGLKLGGAATRQALAQWEIRGAVSSWALPQLGMLSGLLVGNYLAGHPQESLWATLLHFNMAGNLMQRGMGPGFRAWELHLEALTDQSFRNGPRIATPVLAEALASPLPTALEPQAVSISQMSSHEKFPRGESPRELRELYLREFPKASAENFSTEIIEHALATPASFPHFHDHLLEAFASRPNRGSRSQYYTARAVEHVFNLDALNTSQGSFQSAQLQFVLTRILSEDSPVSRIPAIQRIFDAMEAGLQPFDLNTWVRFYAGPELRAPTEPQMSRGFLHRHFHEAAQAWQDYRDQDKVMLFNFVEQASLGNSLESSVLIQLFHKARVSGLYSVVDLEAALQQAAEHPLGKVILHRLAKIIAVEDIGEKIRDLGRPETPRGNLLEDYRSWRFDEGLTLHLITERLRGSPHLALMEDAALSRKVVSVLQDVDEFHQRPALRHRAAARLQQAIEAFLDRAKPLEVADLLNLLETNSSPQTKAILFGWMQKDFEIEIIPKATFEQWIQAWGRVEHYNAALFHQGVGGEKGRIFIMEMPPLDLSSEPGRLQANMELSRRMIGLVHEWEHWRHSSGKYEGIESASAPISMENMTRNQRLVSEMMSLMEEERWRGRNRDIDRWHLASRIGQSVLQYMRDLAERSYYGHSK